MFYLFSVFDVNEFYCCHRFPNLAPNLAPRRKEMGADAFMCRKAQEAN